LVPPTATVFGLPPTWTPTPRPGNVQVIEPAAPSAPGDTVGLPTLRPSRTPEPSPTYVILPTFTPSKTVRVGGPGGPGVGGGNCQVIYQDPADGSDKKRGDIWRTRWTIKNTSTTNWPRGNLDIKFMGGDRVHTSPDAEDLDYDVNAGGAVDIFVDMRVLETDEKGTKTSNWALLEGSRTVCRFYVTFDVK
jgi:hypothetical protein